LQNIGQVWREAKTQLEKADIKTASLDAKILTEFAFNFCGLDLALKEKEIPNTKQLEKLNQYISRRLSGEPIARIIGKKEFYSLNFTLNEATLVPRPESEILVDLTLKNLKDISSPKILELGVGSGCIIISILAHALKAKATGVDLSEKALLIAKKNATLNRVENRVEFIQGSWFEPIEEKFNIIISNPPYIKSSEIADLQKEVRLFDPSLALDGGNDGLEPYKEIAKTAKEYLFNDGLVIVEFGQGQEKSIKEIFIAQNFSFIGEYRDLAGIIRAIIVKK